MNSKFSLKYKKATFLKIFSITQGFLLVHFSSAPCLAVGTSQKPHTYQYLREEGKNWLNSFEGLVWLRGYSGSIWLSGADGRAWLASDPGKFGLTLRTD